ncbi:MAG: RNA polymerase sigma factor [Polyangiaceae bacterium]|jgi:RNA polymerase sigma factor (sigma-70 family)|nr:RNA polymerase sigma factor [Polyangiaceae bacterium]
MVDDSERTRRTIEAVWRVESARLIGGLARFLGDLTLAEDLAQEALVAALEHWPAAGVPQNPGAWLMTAAKNRAVDLRRHEQMRLEKQPAIAADALAPCLEEPTSDEVGDDLLRLVLIACHPVLSTEARAALTLRLVGGLTTDEIARAFLLPEPTVAQRIVRAKRTLNVARVPFEVPRGGDLEARLPSVLEVIYLIFNEGYSAAAGDDWIRPELCQDALRLGRILAALVPAEAEVHGLVALMELHASRMRTRIDARGEPVLLLDQDRSRWDLLLLRRGLAALERAEALRRPLGPYTLQAAISACHARARTAAETDWNRIVALYDALVELTQSPVVELNRAVAVSMALGPAAGLELVDELALDPALRGYHWVSTVRGDLLVKLGRMAEARPEFERAASLVPSDRERARLLARASACG